MVTNTKEYMREYQAKRRAKLKSKEIVKNVKNSVKKKEMFEISLERLNPPLKVETSVESNVHGSFETKEFSSSHVHTDSQASEMDPFLWLASNSSFQMLMLEWVKKIIPGFENIKTRGKQYVIRKSFDNTIIKVRNEKSNMAGVINEFKRKVERLRKRNAKIEK